MASALARPIPDSVSAISAALALLILTDTCGAGSFSATAGRVKPTERHSATTARISFIFLLLIFELTATEGEILNRIFIDDTELPCGVLTLTATCPQQKHHIPVL